MLVRLCFIKGGRVRARRHVGQGEDGIRDGRVIMIVPAALNEEDRQRGVRSSETAGQGASRSSRCIRIRTSARLATSTPWTIHTSSYDHIDL